MPVLTFDQQGTIMFISMDLVVALIRRVTTVQREPKQDLESFLWVLLYVVYKNAVDKGGAVLVDPSLRGELKNEFDKLFSAASVDQLRCRRLSYLIRYEYHKALYAYSKKISSTGRNLYLTVVRVITALKRLIPADLTSDETREMMRMDKEYGPARNVPSGATATLTHDMVLRDIFGGFWSV